MSNLRNWLAQGELQYTRAIELRALTFAECIAHDAPRVLLEARDQLLEISGQARAAAFAVIDAEGTCRDREGFVGPSQGIGDFAQQLVGRSVMRFWKVVEQKMCNGPDEQVWKERAEADLNMATVYWRLANDGRIRGVRGERIIKYVIYLAGVRARQEILHNLDWLWANVDHFLQNEMRSVAREFQVSLPQENDSRLVVPGVKKFFTATRAAYGLGA